jgi:hypothetical protein
LVATHFIGEAADVALDLLEITELAWRDCYGEISSPGEVIEDILVLAEGDLGTLVRLCRLALTDSRDLHVAADVLRNRRPDA